MYQIYAFNHIWRDNPQGYLSSTDLLFSFDIDHDYIKTYLYDEKSNKNVMLKQKYSNTKIVLEYKEDINSKIYYLEITVDNKKIEFLCDLTRRMIVINGVFSSTNSSQKIIQESKYIFIADESILDVLSFVDKIGKKAISFVQ